MERIKVRFLRVEPSGCAVEETLWIALFQLSVGIRIILLTPAFVVDGVGDDTRMGFQMIDRFLGMTDKEFISLRILEREFQFLQSDHRQNSILEEAVLSGIDHVLDDQDAVFIAIVVERFRFDFDVFSKTVETQFSDIQDVGLVVFRFFRGIDSFFEVSLIQQTVDKDRSVIQQQARISVDVFGFQFS